MPSTGKASASKRGAGGIAAAVLALCGVLVAGHEGLVLETYPDPVGIPTACYGHTGPELAYGQHFTKGECDALLNADIVVANAAVHRCIRVPMAVHEEAALTSFAFNAGGTALCASTLARKANAGDWRGACAELDRWVFATKAGVRVKLNGLVKRRAAERAMCEGRT